MGKTMPAKSEKSQQSPQKPKAPKPAAAAKAAGSTKAKKDNKDKKQTGKQKTASKGCQGRRDNEGEEGQQSRGSSQLTEQRVVEKDVCDGDLSLDEKVALLRGNANADVQFSGREWSKLNLRFTQTALKKASPEAKAVWDTASGTGLREGRTHAQHTVLKAWAVDPSMTSHFLTLCRT